jgi:AraC-like DNA-binding protein
MPLLYEKIAFTPHSPLVVRWNKFQQLSYPLHYHDEFELMYIFRSFGKRYVGDSVETFQEGDLVLVGHQLPHCWQNDEVFFKNPQTHPAKAIILQFGKDFFSDAFRYAEFNAIRELLENASRGISFGPTTTQELAPMILQLTKEKGFQRILLFLQLLQALAHATDIRLLASNGFKYRDNQSSTKITQMLQLISEQYTNQLSLDEISSEFNMSPSAFCNYFKRKTGKTLINYLNEYRIAQSCKHLTSSDMNISEIAYLCGFNNLSNFNRIFKRIMGRTPQQYKVTWTQEPQNQSDQKNSG